MRGENKKMVNVYDYANNLAKALKESNEYLEFVEARKKVYQNEETKKKIEDFNQKQYELQVAGLKGENPEKEKMEKLQELYTILASDEEVKKYFDLQVKFNIMLADINRIIAEAVKDAIA